jgi:hypothetical protein
MKRQRDRVVYRLGDRVVGTAGIWRGQRGTVQQVALIAVTVRWDSDGTDHIVPASVLAPVSDQWSECS